MLRPVMTRQDWQRAKRAGCARYVGRRVLPTGLVVAIAVVIGRQQSEQARRLLILGPVILLMTAAYWTMIYKRSQANYEESDTP